MLWRLASRLLTVDDQANQFAQLFARLLSIELVRRRAHVLLARTGGATLVQARLVHRDTIHSEHLAGERFAI